MFPLPSGIKTDYFGGLANSIGESPSYNVLNVQSQSKVIAFSSIYTILAI
jgi:hypothetical protein